MKKTRFQVTLSLVCLMALSLTVTVNASPVRLNQVVQTVSAKPGKAKTSGFTQLSLADDPIITATSKADDDPKAPQQDKRVIVTETIEITDAEACDCPIEIVKGGFPKLALLGLAAVPVGLVLINRKSTPTPTPTTTPTTTPSMTPTTTQTPPITPTPSITPTPEPVPEPMTILLFGTGLAGIGMAARRRLRKKAKAEGSEE